MTKATLINIYNNYASSSMRGLNDCYAKPSPAKICAYKDCQFDMMDHNGGNGSVISYNTFMFTYGYTYHTYENGNVTKHFVYITPSHRYDTVIETF